jgi:hypothetical protein
MSQDHHEEINDQVEHNPQIDDHDQQPAHDHQEHQIQEHPVAREQIPEQVNEVTIREDKAENEVPPELQQVQSNQQPEIIASYEQLPLKSARVKLPEIQDSYIFAHMIYPVSFSWNGKDFEIQRRFSDFYMLRKAIKNFLPFTFVFPVHKKQFIVG